MELARAEKIAAEVVKRVEPCCKRIVVACSIRRRRPIVHDIDIVLLPADAWNLQHEMLGLGPFRRRGEKWQTVSLPRIDVDFYFATEETWPTLVLIRTGSAQHNIKLCTIAKDRGWQPKADGEGLFDERGIRIAGHSEQSIFEDLGLPYNEPWER